MTKKIDAVLEERTSKKGIPYKVLIIKLTDTYEKLVFLDKAEQELLNIKTISPSSFK